MSGYLVLSGISSTDDDFVAVQVYADHHGAGAKEHGVPWVSVCDICAREFANSVDVDVQRGIARDGRDRTSR